MPLLAFCQAANAAARSASSSASLSDLPRAFELKETGCELLPPALGPWSGDTLCAGAYGLGPDDVVASSGRSLQPMPLFALFHFASAALRFASRRSR
jgi:hypothetical protein